MTHRGTEIHVAEYGRQGGNLRVDSCNCCEVPPNAVWEPATGAEISQRLADGGGPKGRILIARAIQFPSPEFKPAAAMILHLDDRVIRILHLGHAVDLIGAQRTFAKKMLLSCAEELAHMHGCGRIELLLHREADLRGWRDLGFRRLGRRDRAYRGLRGNEIVAARPLRGG